MAWTNLGTITWGSGPAIKITFSYDRKRNGADMQYKAKIVVASLTGSHHFGYPIYAKVSMNGSLKNTQTLKNASPSQWSSPIEYESSWYTISNKTTGTTSLSINIYSGSGNSRNNTYSYSMKVDPAASVLGSISNFTIGNAINIPITQYSTSFTHTLAVTFGATTYTFSNVTNGYDVKFSADQLKDIYKKMPVSTSTTFTFKLTTKSGSTTVGTSTKTATGTISSSIKPSISSVTISEAGSVSSSWGIYVKNRSKLKFVISASAGSGSSISSYKTTVNGVSYNGSTITTNTVTASGTITATIEVTDKRGRKTRTTKSISVLDYANPYITTLTAFRCNSDGSANDKGTYMKISLTAGVTSLSGKNTYSYKIQYKKSSISTYTTINITGQDQTCSYSTVVAIESTSSYDVKAIVADYFTEVNISAQPVPSVFRTMHFRVGGHGIGLGKMAEYEDVLDIGFETMFTGGIKAIDIPSGANLSSYKVPGFYRCIYNTTAATLSNCPTGGKAFGMRVEQTSGIMQTIQTYETRGWKIYKRSYYDASTVESDGWGPWYEVPSMTSMHPIGSVIITSTNSNPSTNLGGTWSLIDKELAPKTEYTTSGTSLFTPNNLSAFTARHTVAGHNGYIVLDFTSKSAFNDTWAVIGTFNFSALGVSRIGHSVQAVGFSDGGNAVLMCVLSYSTGEIGCHDIVGADSIAAGQKCMVTFNFPIHHNWMIDSACNKFYWKRTA